MSEPNLSDTIFDPDLPPAESDPARHQRICGLYVLHGVNPHQVVKGSAVVSAHESGDVLVSFLAAVPSALGGAKIMRTAHIMGGYEGLICEHGDEPHVAAVRGSFFASWDEVAL